MKVILDTNFLIYCTDRKIDFIQEIERLFDMPEVVVPIQVVSELRAISRKGKGKDSKAAALALEIIEGTKNKAKFKVAYSDEADADKAILSLAGKDSFIASFDKELKNSAHASRFLRIKNKALSIID